MLKRQKRQKAAAVVAAPKVLSKAELVAKKDKAAHKAWVLERESAHKGNVKVRNI